MVKIAVQISRRSEGLEDKQKCYTSYQGCYNIVKQQILFEDLNTLEKALSTADKAMEVKLEKFSPPN